MRLNEIIENEALEQYDIPSSSSTLPLAASRIADEKHRSPAASSLESHNQHQQSCFSPKQLYIITALITIAFVAYILLTEGILNNRRPSVGGPATPSPST